MAKSRMKEAAARFRARHRGRGAQLSIYIGKLLRMFIYQSDWKMLPMSALVAGLVGLVTRRRMFLSMEGTLMGSFALVCVCIWNGSFNSIQVICRERDVIKREHRSGMHISTYIAAHMFYQLLICTAQTAITLYVTRLAGVHYEKMTPLFTPWAMLDLGVSLLLITFASDMMSLWLSSLSRSTTTAMTVMPFVLIFQLVFSGGMLNLPEWTKSVCMFTISNPGLKVVAAQSDINDRPFVTITDMLGEMRKSEVTGTVTVGQILDMLTSMDDGGMSVTVGGKTLGEDIKLSEFLEALEDARDGEATRNALQAELASMTVADLIVSLGSPEGSEAIVQEYGDMKLADIAAAYVAGSQEEGADMQADAAVDLQAVEDESITITTTVGDVLDKVGEDKVLSFIEEKAGEASYSPDYEKTRDNITWYWLHLLTFAAAFSLLAVITLEFIDKDRR